MTRFVGAEYLIARMLIEKNAQEVSMVELNKLGICVRRLSDAENIDAVFLTSRSEVYTAIFDFSDYFKCTYDDDNELIGIKICEGKSIDDLNSRFMGYLPENIVELLNKAVLESAA